MYAGGATESDAMAPMLVHWMAVTALQRASYTSDCAITVALSASVVGAVMTRIDSAHANPKAQWLAMGSPQYPSTEQLAQLEGCVAAQKRRLADGVRASRSLEVGAALGPAETTIELPPPCL